jgi:hypothetical protein
LTAGQQILGREGVGEFLQTFRVAAFEEGVGTLLEVDLLLAHPDGQPVVLIEAHSGSERKVWAQANEHTPPTGIVEVEVVLDDPALSHLEVPAVILLVAVGDEDPSWLTGFEDGYDLIGLGLLEVRVNEVIAPAIGRFQHRDAPLLRAVRYPVFVLLGDITEFIAGDALAVAIGVEESDTRSGCWKGWISPFNSNRSKHR